MSDSWIDLKREIVQVAKDQRKNPRIELHCPVLINGLKDDGKITDLSIGGVFVESNEEVQVGQKLVLFMKLPPKHRVIVVKATVANIKERGFGCEFTQMKQCSLAAIYECFEVYRHTLPVKGLEEIDEIVGSLMNDQIL